VVIDRSTRSQVERVLDARLVEAARMVSSLLSDHRVKLDPEGRPIAIPMPAPATYRRELSCQIWTLQGMLVGQSGAAPVQAMSAPGQTGFSERMIDGEKWRVYTAVNQRLGLRISVGDSIAVREGLVQAVIRSVLMPAAVMLPVLALLIWFATARGLAPLDQLAAGLRARGAGDLSPLPDGPTPQEIRPVRQALDALLARVRTHREHERDFIAFAAHELKTPLAGLKMQAQIALRAEDEETRRHALEVMERSVTRTDRAVRQLLELARVGQTEAGGTPARTGDVARSVVTELAFFAEARQVALRLVPGPDGEVADGLVLAVVLRNLVENAIQATPAGGTVALHTTPDTIDIRDGGTGIPDSLRARLFQKFAKGANRNDGTGLGLAIVRQALDQIGADVEFVMAGDGHHARVHLHPRTGQSFLTGEV